MSARILILSDPIAPPSFAPRVMSMYRYLQAAGHDVVLEAGELPKHQSRGEFLADKLWMAGDRAFGKHLLKKYPQGRFDILLCSTYYYFPLVTTQLLSRAWGIPYVIDLRDIVEQWGKAQYFTTPLPHLFGIERLIARWYEQRNLRLRNRILHGAKAVTTISPWHRDHLQSLSPAPVHLIYNGYEEEEMHFEARTNEKFVISFIGRVISLSLRQPHLLLEAVGEMIRAGEEVTQVLSLDFYSEPALRPEVEALAERYGALSCLHWQDFVGRDQLNAIMAESSILLALGCPPQEEQHGILGTKVFEAIGVEKPLLLAPSDGDSLSALIQETGIGMAANNKEEVKSFIRQKYDEWKLNGFTRQLIPSKEEFNRKNEARQMESVILSNMNSAQ